MTAGVFDKTIDQSAKTVREREREHTNWDTKDKITSRITPNCNAVNWSLVIVGTWFKLVLFELKKIPRIQDPGIAVVHKNRFHTPEHFKDPPLGIRSSIWSSIPFCGPSDMLL